MTNTNWYKRATWGTIDFCDPDKGDGFMWASLRVNGDMLIWLRSKTYISEKKRILLTDAKGYKNCPHDFTQDMVYLDFDYHYLKAECYITEATEWSSRNFPQTPIRLSNKNWILLSEDDLVLATLARDEPIPKETVDYTAIYCPYIPLTMTGVKLDSQSYKAGSLDINYKVYIETSIARYGIISGI